jgi:hypothetical protein
MFFGFGFMGDVADGVIGQEAVIDACVAGARLTGLALNGMAFGAAVTPLLGWRGASGLTALFHARKNSGTFILL